MPEGDTVWLAGRRLQEALAVREGSLGRLAVERSDGASLLAPDSPVAATLERAGFRPTPRGLRLRA